MKLNREDFRNMAFFISLTFLSLALFAFSPQIQAFESWNDLRVTFGISPIGNFNRLPRNTIDAAADGWQKLSETCENGGRFSGFQWIDPEDSGVALLYDTRGQVAGIQSLVPQSEVLDPASDYNYLKVPLYRNYTINGTKYFAITAYFIHPSLICTGGLENGNIGAHSQVYFQNGPTDNHLKIAPRNRSEAIAIGWTKNNCIPGMGHHNFYEVDKYEETNCTEVDPTCLLYNDKDELLGFCLRYEGMATSPRYEHASVEATVAIYGNPPQCLLDLTEAVGRRTVHVYFQNSPWTITC